MPRTSWTTSSLAFCWAVLFLACAGLDGCGPDREETIWILGSHLFLIYALSLTAVLVLQRLHRWPVFIAMVEKVKTPAAVLGGLVATGGSLLIATGIPDLFEDPGPAMLTSFLGVMVLIAGIHLCLWARASAAGDKAGHAKVFTMTAGFVVGLVYILGGVNSPILW